VLGFSFIWGTFNRSFNNFCNSLVISSGVNSFLYNPSNFTGFNSLKISYSGFIWILVKSDLFFDILLGLNTGLL